MNRAFVVLMLTTGCTVPTLGELGVRGCNDQHPCAQGALCVNNVCQASSSDGGGGGGGGGGACRQGDTQLCGSSVGECSIGARLCENGAFGICLGERTPSAEVCDGLDNDCNNKVDDGVLGPACPALDGGVAQGVCASAKLRCVDGGFESTCSVASFGPDFEPLETRCDGKDNDCNGLVDENLIGPCPLQAGVCLGTKIACAGGAYPSCALVYASKAGFEAFEQSCDGLDNDCDGKIDQWAPQNLSASPAVSRRPSGAVTDGGLLVLWEEGSRVSARLVNPDGTLSAAVTPSDSINVAARAYAPVVVSDGPVVVAAWAEQTGTGQRVMVAPLDSTGRSVIMAGTPPTPSAMPIQLPGSAVGTDVVTDLSLAVDRTTGHIFVGVVLNGRALSLYVFPLGIPAAENLKLVDAIGADAGKVSLASAGPRGLLFAAEALGPAPNLRRCLVAFDAGITCVPGVVAGVDPKVVTSSGGFAVISWQSGGQVFGQDATALVADGGALLPGTNVFFAPGMSNLDLSLTLPVSRGAGTWVSGDDVKALFFDYRVWVLGDGGLPTADAGTTTLGKTVLDARPRALVMPGHYGILTEGDPSGPLLNEIVLYRSCAP